MSRRRVTLVSIALVVGSPLSTAAQPAGERATLSAAFKADGATAAVRSPPFRLEADVSMRSIPVDVRFSGARLVIFGSVDPVPPAGSVPLDIVALVTGARSKLTVHRKENVAGLWINMASVDFDQAPRFYAVMSSRPIELIATANALEANGIGFAQVPMTMSAADKAPARLKMIEEFRDAAIADGIRDRHYVRQDTGLSFVGKSLFRGQIDLPPNIPVGELDVRFLLFRSGELVARHDSHVTLNREGFEHFIYEFSRRQPLLYGVFTVLIATGMGLMSSFIVGLHKRR